MKRLQLVCTEHVDGREVFFANANHPEASALRALVASEVARPAPPTADDELTKRQLVALGAPLRGADPVAVEDADRVTVLAKGMSLARRDPVVARALPLCVWRSREFLTARDLVEVLPAPADRHVAGFFLELTSELGNDRRLLGVAESLRDRRMTAVQPFFQVPTTSRHPATRSFPLAEKWGFSMNVDLAAFRSLFEKFSTQ